MALPRNSDGNRRLRIWPTSKHGVKFVRCSTDDRADSRPRFIEVFVGDDYEFDFEQPTVPGMVTALHLNRLLAVELNAEVTLAHPPAPRADAHGAEAKSHL